MTPRIEKTVFISYRRTNFPWALNIYQDLTHHGYDVFFDYESINSGDFEKVILDNIKARAHFIVILTPSALERCKEPNDWLRREIETAIDEKRNIVPLMMEGFDFSSPLITQALTGKLTKLSSKNGLPIYAAYFFDGMEKLRNRYLNVTLEDVDLHVLSEQAKEVTETQKAAANDAPPVEKEQLTAQEWYERGYVYGKDENYDEAIRCFTEAIRLQPDFSDAFGLRGTMQTYKGHDHEAINDFTEAIRFKPDFAETFVVRGVSYWSIGDLDKAMNDLNEAIRLKPELAKAYEYRGILFKERNNLNASIADYSEVIRLEPDNARAYNLRGTARQSNNDLLGALADFNEAIRLKPDYADVYVLRGITRTVNKDLRGALEDFDEALHLRPDDISIYRTRAFTWKMKKNYASALADYQKYLDLGGGKRDGDQKEVEKHIKSLKSKLAKKKPIAKKKSK